MVKKYHNANNILTILAIFGGISFLIISLAVAYYLVIYLPKKDIQKLELENKQTESQLSNKKLEYDSCLIRAKSSYRENWFLRCKANNYKIFKDESGNDNCQMPDSAANSVNNKYNADKEDCLKIYQAN